MIVRDILKPGKPIKLIQVRTNYPEGIKLETGDKFVGMMHGYCSWDGENLISEDGDNYSLDDEIYGFLESSDDPVPLTYWIKSNWISG